MGWIISPVSIRQRLRFDVRFTLALVEKPSQAFFVEINRLTYSLLGFL